MSKRVFYGKCLDAVLHRVRSELGSHQGRRIDWDRVAQGINGILKYYNEPAITGQELNRWLNDGRQKKIFSGHDWFAREWDSWRKSIKAAEEENRSASCHFETSPSSDLEVLAAAKPTTNDVQREEPPEAIAALVTQDDAQVPKTDASRMLFQGVVIRMRGERGSEQMCLTDMWRANGSDPARRPADWTRSEQARGLHEFLSENMGVGNSHSLIFSEKGTPQIPGSTWAHWQLAFAYAKYLSPSFHAWVNQAAREKMASSQALTRSAPPMLEASHAVVPNGDPPAWVRSLFEALGTGVTSAHRKAVAAEELSAVAHRQAESARDAAESARAHAEQAERKAESAERLALEASKAANNKPALPPIPRDWVLARLLAEQNGLPSRGPGARLVQTICEALGMLDNGTAKRVRHQGVTSCAVSPLGVERIRPSLSAAHHAMHQYGYQIRGNVMIHRDDIKPPRCEAWVVTAMLQAAMNCTSAQMPLKVIKGGA